MMGVLIFSLNKNAEIPSPKQENFVAGFDADTMITISYLSKNFETSQKIVMDDKGKKILPPFPHDNGFEIHYKIDNKKDFYDVTLTKNQNTMTIQFKELPLDSKISVLNTAHINLPVDWAGHLTLSDLSLENQNICVEIAEPQNNPRQLCANLDKGGKA